MLWVILAACSLKTSWPGTTYILLFWFENRRVFYTRFYFENFKDILQLMQSLSMSNSILFRHVNYIYRVSQNQLYIPQVSGQHQVGAQSGHEPLPRGHVSGCSVGTKRAWGSISFKHLSFWKRMLDLYCQAQGHLSHLISNLRDEPEVGSVVIVWSTVWTFGGLKAAN